MGAVQKSPPRRVVSGCADADELHLDLEESGRFYGDVTAIYVWLVKTISPRNLRVIYGVNRDLGCS